MPMKTKKQNSNMNRRAVLRCLLLLLLVAAIAALQFFLIRGGDTTAAEERAAAAARQVSTLLQQEIEGGLRQLNVAAAAISGDAASKDALLDSAAAHGSFERVELMDAGASAASYIRYEFDGVASKIIMEDDGAIQLRVPAGKDAELAGWLDSDEVRNILCSAYPEDYVYAVYNAATGAYLLTNAAFPDAGYYDTLHALNDGGRTGKLMLAQLGQAHIGGDAGFYIAQQPSGIDPWGIALFIPEEIIGFDPANSSLTLALAIACAVLQLVLLVLMAVYAVRSVRSERRRRVTQEQVSACMLNQATEDAQIGIYIYRRSGDGYSASFDGLHFASEADDAPVPESFSAFALAYGMEEDDAESLYDRLREIKSGERYEMSLNCAAHDRERVLRFELRCPACDSDCVIISVRDATLEAERADNIVEEERFRRLMLPKCSAVWQVNVSRNRWYLTDGKPGHGIRHLAVGVNSWRDYSNDLNGALREYIHPKDYPKCVETMGIAGLTAMTRAGRTQATLEYRARMGDEYQWHRLLVRIFRSMDNGDLLANLYVLNVDAEKNAELERQERARILQQTLTALGGIYYGLYYVELDSDMCYTAKSHGGGPSSQLSQSFKAAFSTYIDQNVHPEDQEAMRRILEPYNLRKSMTEASHLVRFEYRRRIGDHFEPAAIVIQAARFENGTIRDIVLAMRKYGSEKKAPESI